MLNMLVLALLLCCGAAAVQSVQSGHPLDDDELAQVSGRDGIGIAMHLALNEQGASGAVVENRVSIGTTVDGQTNYIVLKNLHGTIDMFALDLSVQKKPDGADYVEIGLPGYLKFGNFGFDSLSVQADPAAPVTDSLGRVSINGTLSMQGQLRLGSH
jgi:hypothetical protein